MKQKRELPAAGVTKKAEHSILSGHPWIYDTEVIAPPDCEDGALCDVLSVKGSYLGSGFYNSHSKIRIRLLSRNANDRFDEAFLNAAFAMRGSIAKLFCGRRICPAAVLFLVRRILFRVLPLTGSAIFW